MKRPVLALLAAVAVAGICLVIVDDVKARVELAQFKQDWKPLLLAIDGIESQNEHARLAAINTIAAMSGRPHYDDVSVRMPVHCIVYVLQNDSSEFNREKSALLLTQILGRNPDDESLVAKAAGALSKCMVCDQSKSVRSACGYLLCDSAKIILRSSNSATKKRVYSECMGFWVKAAMSKVDSELSEFGKELLEQFQ